jgi:UDP-glucose 4-epimerase
LPVTEDTPIAEPVSVYGATKQICEQILRDTVASGAPLRATMLRYFNPIGAHPSGEIGELPIGPPQNLIPAILQTAAGWRGPVQVFGGDWSTPDGSCIRDFIHVLDLAAAHVKSLAFMASRRESSLLEVLNVGTGRGTSVREALAAFERATGRPVAFEVGDRRDGDIEQIYASVEKAERVLQWRASRTLEEALRDAWRWQSGLTRDRGLA